MITKVVPGTLIAVDAAKDAGPEAAARIARVVRKKLDGSSRARARIALSGGTSPRGAYEALARTSGIDWSRVDVFFVDERAVPPTSDRSNYRMVKESLLDPARVANENVFRMEAEQPDLDAAARAYHDLVHAKVPLEDGVPAFDLVVFGVGADGHTASLFPHTPALSIVDRWATSVAADGAREARMTLTVPVLERARSAVVLATGAEKHAALERIWQVAGKIDDTPARIIRAIRGGIVWIIDRAAGGL